MTTSGVVTFSRTRDQIIAQAARKIGAIAGGETPSAQTVTDFAEAMNIMVKHWQGQGIQIWRTTEAVLFLQTDQSRYSIGSASTDHATESFVETTISAAEAAGQTTISLTDTTDITAADVIGIELDAGTFHWTTVTSKTSTTVLIPSALASAAAAGNRVVTYTTPLVRPLAVLAARRFNFDSDIETALQMFDRLEYMEMPNKNTGGPINGIYYDRRGGANSLGLLYAWPMPDSINDCITMTVARPIQDFTVAGDTSDLPTEWMQALIFNLALVMAPEYDVPPPKFSMIKMFADQYLADATWSEDELTAIEFVPARRF